MVLHKIKVLLTDRTSIRHLRVVISLLRKVDINRDINNLQTINKIKAISNHKVTLHSKARIDLRQIINSPEGTNSFLRIISKAILSLATRQIKEGISNRKAISSLHKAIRLSKQATKATRLNPASRLKVHRILMPHHIHSPDNLGNLQINNRLILRMISMVRMALSLLQAHKTRTQHLFQPRHSLTQIKPHRFKDSLPAL